MLTSPFNVTQVHVSAHLSLPFVMRRCMLCPVSSHINKDLEGCLHAERRLLGANANPAAYASDCHYAEDGNAYDDKGFPCKGVFIGDRRGLLAAGGGIETSSSNSSNAGGPSSGSGRRLLAAGGGIQTTASSNAAGPSSGSGRRLLAAGTQLGPAPAPGASLQPASNHEASSANGEAGVGPTSGPSGRR